MTARRALPWLALLLAIGTAGGCRDGKHESGREGPAATLKRLVALPPPTNAMIDPIEPRLAKVPCIGNLGRWERLFSYHPGSFRDGPDEGRIDYAFFEAGRFDFRAGRRIAFPDSWNNLDDRPYRFATGWFDRKTGKLQIDFCGHNTAARPGPHDIDAPVDIG